MFASSAATSCMDAFGGGIWHSAWLRNTDIVSVTFYTRCVNVESDAKVNVGCSSACSHMSRWYAFLQNAKRWAELWIANCSKAMVQTKNRSFQNHFEVPSFLQQIRSCYSGHSETLLSQSIRPVYSDIFNKNVVRRNTIESLKHQSIHG